MLITTTPNLEGYLITEYLEPVTVNKTINVVDLSEWLFGVQDSTSSLRGMEKLKKQAIQDLIEKSASIEADAIVSYSLDYDTIGVKVMVCYW